MDKAVKGTPTNFGLSKVAKKRIAGLISIIILVVLLSGLSADQRILGNWEFNQPSRVEGEDILIYQFEENGLGRIYNKTSPEAAPHSIRNFGYALDDSKLVIIENGKEQVYDYSFTFNKLYLNDAGDHSFDYMGSFSPLLQFFLITILSLFILWCAEEDLNAFLRTEGRWRKALPNKKRRILAAIAFVICIIFAVITFIPSLRLAETWNADVLYNTDEKMPEANKTATYTFNGDDTGRYYNVFKNGDVSDETFKYATDEVLSIVYPNDSKVPNAAYILAENPDITLPGSYTVDNANIVRKDVTVKGKAYLEVVLEGVTYEFADDGTGLLKINKATATTLGNDYVPSETFTYVNGGTNNLTSDQLQVFKDVKFTYTTGTDLILTFDSDSHKEIYEYSFWFDTLFLDRIGDGDNNTYDCLYTVETWFSPTFKLTISVIALLVALYFMSVDIEENKKKREDAKKVKEAEKAKKKIAAK